MYAQLMKISQEEIMTPKNSAHLNMENPNWRKGGKSQFVSGEN